MKKLKIDISIMSLVLSVFFMLIPLYASGKDMTAKDMVDEAKATVKSISVSDASSMQGKSGVFFLDVREPSEFKSGHVPGALNIPRGLVEFQIEQQIPDKTATVLVYCKGGGRSVLAAASLLKMGYKNILNVEGGWGAWLNAGYPAE